MTEQTNPEDYKHKLELFQTMAEVNSKEQEIKSKQKYGMAYLWSVLIPPIGIYYFVKYVFFANTDDESVRAGIISLVLTLASLLLSIWLLSRLFTSTTSSLPPQNLQMLKDVVAPENQKKLLELYK
ncbi:hypothetical protein COY62_03395 [bacterium (Candidatus Howlettbacteria) CG_4_10_14_0_8_um_filter_40_9]|nr:MAG: hypothetical protein COY62_03395 [bacterium (Candidatus Howlettbacteria) CG_4_10_14_0_8_um_filter_40_9]